MPKVETWGNFPAAIRQHLIDRMLDRAIGIADLDRLRLWIEARPEVPDGDWYKDFGSFKICGHGRYPKTFLLRGQAARGESLCVHFEDQLASAKKCGHMGGKVLVPTQEFIQKLVAARLAADISGVPTVLIARTDANSAHPLTGSVDPRDEPFLTGERTPEGFLTYRGGIEAAISRGLAYAPYADLIWCETSEPNIKEARQFADTIHEEFPGKMLAYNCSPSFNWRAKLDGAAIAKFQREMGAMGYKFQFVTLAGFHSLNLGMFDLARGYAEHGMSAYAELQDREFASADAHGYAAVRHQRFVGTGYFDQIANTITGGMLSTAALKGSTEEAQFAAA
jgi:isocitrate lyase